LHQEPHFILLFCSQFNLPTLSCRTHHFRLLGL